MNESIFQSLFKWLSNNRPDLMILIFIIGGTIWFTSKLVRLEDRVNDVVTTEIPKIHNDINDLRTEMNMRFKQVDVRFKEVETRFDTRFDQVDDRLSQIEKILIKIDTYLSTKDKGYPK